MPNWKEPEMPYLPNTEQDRAAMLAKVGAGSVAELFDAVPASHRFPELKLPKAASEMEILNELYGLALKNSSTGCFATFLGAGAYNHFVPSVIPYLATRGEFLTAYTPYQPEVSQGTLQAMFEYQSMVCQPDRHGSRQRQPLRRGHFDGGSRHHGRQRLRNGKRTQSHRRALGQSPVPRKRCAPICQGMGR
jgi:hypothetical protein